jgi:hypothetical protein
VGNIIQPQVDCHSAHEFLDALSPIGSHFKDTTPSEAWLFRGQGQDYLLIPSAFRNPDKLSILLNRKINGHKERGLAERNAVIQFFRIADKRGLVVPDDSQALRSIIETLNSDRGNQFIGTGYDDWHIYSRALSLTALAQHYGIPTRLLDWTMRSFIAAFFAAEDAIKHRTEYDRTSVLVVWAFLFPALGKHDALFQQNDPIRIVTAPSATNPNLKAQQGVFTLLNQHYTKEATESYLPMEQVLRNLEAQPDLERHHPVLVGSQLKKFTLPVSEAFGLQDLLSKLDITASLVYPGFHSIIRDIEMQNWTMK